jgi:maltose alpha-D-glucosyltransferase/alpha-amylase
MLLNEPLWYKDAILYELHVRAFHDSVGDGMGDFTGLTQKLDYLQDLGISAIWLLPFYPSPLRDDGYDIADYASIHPDYGTLESFREFLEAAHARGLRVITELVINHTSDQHPWFQRARRAPPGSPERDFYVWSDTPDKYRGVRIIFKDFEHSNWTYDNIAKSYYWHRFYSHQPDLNYDNPEVWKAVLPLCDFWFELGVDGLRLDAVPYLFEREGTNCENLPETHAFLKALRRHIDERFPNRMLLAEANQWPEDAVAYFGHGDECHMAFHFPLMPRLFMAIHSEDRFPVVDIMEQTPAIPENCQWAVFLRNHDELTLEMVTDEERDYMYRAYAYDARARINLGIRRRLAPLLGNSRRRIELMNGLLFSLPGTPVLYYGDEIGMGDNIYLGDRNGVRTPMQWSADRNAGFSRANPQKLYLPVIIDPEYHYESINVEAQQNNPNSLLWWTKRLISLRRSHKAFSRGTLEFLRPANRRMLAFLRKYEHETVLVVANLSRFVQFVELDLSAYAGVTPVELFGGTSFPQIGQLPYLLTLGPHSFYWFSLSAQPVETVSALPPPNLESLPEIRVPAGWNYDFSGAVSRQLEAALRPYIARTRAGRKRPGRIRNVRLRDSVEIPTTSGLGHLLLVDVEQSESESEIHCVPLVLASADAAQSLAPHTPSPLVARLAGGAEGILCDGTQFAEFNLALLQAIEQSKLLFATRDARVQGVRGRSEWSLPEHPLESLRPAKLGGEHFNVPVAFGEQFVLKLFPRVEAGPHPEAELGRWLTDVQSNASSARWLGALEYRPRREEPITLAVLHDYVPNEGNAWQYTLDELSLFFERVLASPEAEREPPVVDAASVAAGATELPHRAAECLGTYPEMVRLMARRLVELHALLVAADDPSLAPEDFSLQYQRSLYQTMRNRCADSLAKLSDALPGLPEWLQENARRILQSRPLLNHRFHRLLERRVAARRSRCHGDCHLGQLLFTGKDFVFIDFEGMPFQSLTERRLKRTPLRDVVSMLRSFDYVAKSAVRWGSSARKTRTCCAAGRASGRGW